MTKIIFLISDGSREILLALGFVLSILFSNTALFNVIKVSANKKSCDNNAFHFFVKALLLSFVLFFKMTFLFILYLLYLWRAKLDFFSFFSFTLFFLCILVLVLWGFSYKFEALRPVSEDHS